MWSVPTSNCLKGVLLNGRPVLLRPRNSIKKQRNLKFLEKNLKKMWQTEFYIPLSQTMKKNVKSKDPEIQNRIAWPVMIQKIKFSGKKCTRN